MVDLLIKSGASAKNPGKYNGETEPLEIATSYCDEPVVQMLVAAGADINAWTATRFSPLAIAKYHAKNTSYKRYEIAKFLEEKRAVCEAPKVLDFKSGTFNASSVVN